MPRFILTALVAIALSAAQSFASDQATIETVAGTGLPNDNGRNGLATEMNIDQPFGVELSPDGALYICEVGHHRVRRLDLAKQQLTTVAGTGAKGYSGDGGRAVDARLNEPYEVRFDRGGNLYFVEMRNHLVRRVEKTTGHISTVAGDGQPGFRGDGEAATAARLRDPHSIAFDARDRLYIADIGNHRIRRVDLKTGRIETVAGTGEKKLPRDGVTATGESLYGPRALFIVHDDLWIALREGNSIWRLKLTENTLHHEAGTGAKGYSGDGGPARLATFDGPKGIAVTPDGDVGIVDTENQAIRLIDHRTGVIRTVAGGGPSARGYAGDGEPAIKARLDRPHGICVGADGGLFVGDTNNHRVRQVR
jgi:streptogramin lyase